MSAKSNARTAWMLAALVFIGIAWGRAYYLQRGHFIEAEKYHSQQNWKIAIREYDAAMHFHTPWSPYVEKSALRLWDMGEMFEKQGAPDWALVAYSSIRSSYYASRSLYTPGRSWIDRCDEKIAGLSVDMLVANKWIDPEGAEAERANFLYTLKADRAPRPGWTLAALASFLGWVGAAVFVVVRGVGPDGGLRGRAVLSGGLLFAALFALWVVALLRA